MCHCYYFLLFNINIIEMGALALCFIKSHNFYIFFLGARFSWSGFEWEVCLMFLAILQDLMIELFWFKALEYSGG